MMSSLSSSSACRRGFSCLRNRRAPSMHIAPASRPSCCITRSSTHARPKFDWEERRTSGEFAPEELERRIDRIKKLTTEAQLCLKDCVEPANAANFEEELRSAARAVDNAELAHSELLEELASRDCVRLLNEVRKIHAAEVVGIWTELRSALHQLKRNQ